MTYDYVVGMDVGKYFHHACVLDIDGTQVLSKRINQNEKSLRDLTPVWWTPDIQPSRAGRKVIYHHVQVLRTVQTRCRGPLRKQ